MPHLVALGVFLSGKSRCCLAIARHETGANRFTLFRKRATAAAKHHQCRDVTILKCIDKNKATRSGMTKQRPALMVFCTGELARQWPWQ